MKLSKTLMTSGSLTRGETVHCTQWEFPAARRRAPAGRLPDFRRAEARRARGQNLASKQSLLQATVRWLARRPID
jgi:hypothetical protein